MPPRMRLFFAAVITALMTSGLVRADDSAARRSLRAAHGLLQRGMTQLAIPEYESALRAGLEDGQADEARYGLAVCHSRLANWDEAVQALEAIRGSDRFAFASDAAMLRTRCLMMTGEFDKAADAAEALTGDTVTSEARAEAFAMRVECLYRAGRTEDAARAWRQSGDHQTQPGPRARAGYFAARALSDLDRHGDAATLLLALSDIDDTETLAEHRSLLLGRCLEAAGRDGEARILYEHISARADNALAPDAMLALARLLHRAGDEAGAIRTLEHLLDLHPSSAAAPFAELDLATHLLAAGDPDRARRLVMHAQTVGGAGLLDECELLLARCDLETDDPVPAADRLRGVLDRIGDDPRADAIRYELAVALSRAGSHGQSRAILEALLSTPNVSLRSDAGAAMIGVLQAERDDEALAGACARFAEEHPDDPRSARILLSGGAACERLGDAAGAERAYRDAARSADSTQRPLAVLRLGLLLRSQGRAEESAQVLGALETSHDPSLASGLLALGDMAWEAGDLDRAASALERFLELDPAHASGPQAHLTLALIDARRGDHASAAARLDRLTHDRPDSPVADHAQLARATALLEMGRVADAEEALEAAAASDDPEIAVSALRQLAHLVASQGDARRASELFTRAAALDSGDRALDSRLRAGVMLADAGDQAGAEQAYTRVIQGDPDGPHGAEAAARRALLRLARGQNEPARPDLDDALVKIDSGPLRAALLMAKATLLANDGSRDEAAAILSEAAETTKDPITIATANYELARLRTEQARHAEAFVSLLAAQRQIEAASDRMPGSLREGVLYLLAANALARDDLIAAASLASDFLETCPESSLAVDAALVGGEALRRLDRPGESLPMLELAAEAEAPRAARLGLLRLGESLASLQRWEESEAAYARFLARFPEDEQAFRALFGRAWAIENAGEPARAMTVYREVIDSHNGPTAARAQFQIGECLFATGDHEQAVREFMKVDLLFAEPEWSAAALYEAGRCLGQLGDAAGAATQYTQVVERFGGTQWGELARRALTKSKEAGGA